MAIARGEDEVQEAFLRLDAATAGRTLDEPVGYLCRIIRNLAIDCIRRRSVEGRHVTDARDVEGVAEDHDDHRYLKNLLRRAGPSV
ncbi:hypothetical protein J1C56_10170 [Aminobacter anthyllidis]|uniref:RNA polymerase sigma-70 region 2 domain-containing protein n=1 Tax=Aminobacter anthyllidis TaxID=1035067 RepID=A0A9X1D5G4_9HYPH|nr:sigma factor [Aminobacter anthyllidis]MBT1155956.1 hypothetical protein [Aminobacter anthyllidis]